MSDFTERCKDKDYLEMACELVYEAITGECWHRYGDIFQKIHEAFRHSYCKCGKCGHEIGPYAYGTISPYRTRANPPLATSLDAWKPLWEKIDDKLFAVLHSHILHKYGKRGHTDPIKWLEVSLDIKIECGKCGGEGKHVTLKSAIDVARGTPFAKKEYTSYSCKDGKVSLMEALNAD